ncbi:hypothetical protein C7T94_11155 [Pedobacter yulinensis]|uniref:Lipoprotein n=1 Tax=Pedobacter yulinensis TaxID=2126353 RepID=A0A2T3HL86_9SPHI|nr:hypothetical protein [Pedobacter yulinensis]PST83151.1 hypothetical protein C7T94_11155 [Pedobacter yulinensis]
MSRYWWLILFVVNCLSCHSPVSQRAELADTAEQAADAVVPEKPVAAPPASSGAGNWDGIYRINVAGEETTSGTSSSTYHFKVRGQKAELTMTTYHEPIRCEGIYLCEEKSGQLRLTYAGHEQDCRQDGQDFLIRQEGGQFYIKGYFGEAYAGQWLELMRVPAH